MNFRNLLIVLAVISLVGVGTTAFAGWGRGWGYRGNCYGTGNLSEEQYKKLEAVNDTFFKETETLRRRIYEKELALQGEMIKENPDSKTAADLQREISELESQLDQRRLEQRLEIQKINPDAGRGYMGRGGMGPGFMHRRYMGRGYMGGGSGGFGSDYCPWR